jgi:hypothetical protein
MQSFWVLLIHFSLGTSYYSLSLVVVWKFVYRSQPIRTATFAFSNRFFCSLLMLPTYQNSQSKPSFGTMILERVLEHVLMRNRNRFLVFPKVFLKRTFSVPLLELCKSTFPRPGLQHVGTGRRYRTGAKSGVPPGPISGVLGTRSWGIPHSSSERSVE